MGRLLGPLFEPISDLNRLAKARSVWGYALEHGVSDLLIVGAGWRGVTELVLGTALPRVVFTDLYPENNKRPYVTADGCRLPFADKSFDLVFSNSVVEHVGDEAAQQAFVDEHRRVGRRAILTTGNRWFPFELHTLVPLVHYSRRWCDGRAEFTRLLSRNEFAALLPPSAELQSSGLGATLTGTFECA